MRTAKTILVGIFVNICTMMIAMSINLLMDVTMSMDMAMVMVTMSVIGMVTVIMTIGMAMVTTSMVTMTTIGMGVTKSMDMGMTVMIGMAGMNAIESMDVQSLVETPGCSIQGLVRHLLMLLRCMQPSLPVVVLVFRVLVRVRAGLHRCLLRPLYCLCLGLDLDRIRRSLVIPCTSSRWKSLFMSHAP